jgi:hypothetical protein
MNWQQYDALDSEEYLRIEEIVGERVAGEAKEPFLIEPFCAQVSWMKKGECPVYPYNFQGEGICDFMYKPKYENYRCPNVRCIDTFNPIIKKGTKEHKDALAYLARVWKKYTLMENPPFKKRNSLSAETISLLFMLELEKEAMELLEKFPIHSRLITPEQDSKQRFLESLEPFRIKSRVPFAQARKIVL